MNVDINSISGLPGSMMDNTNFNPIVLGILILIIIIYFFIFNALGKQNKNQTTSTKSQISLLDIFLWAIFILLILINGVAYFFNIDIVASITNLFSGTPTVTIKAKNESGLIQPKTSPSSKGKKIPKNKITKQVFNIPGNIYTYKEAEAVCKAYDAKLANYSELETDYKKGADWCNYGWSEDQMILYPTQKKTWEKLQKVEGHENDCGRPGINGGFIDNPNAKFGVNCYGYKPKITPTEKANMKNHRLYPLTNEELEFNKMVKNYKTNINDIVISPFNNNNWNII